MINDELIAPCGMNCALCSSYLAYQNDLKKRGVQTPYCKGCRPRNKNCAFLKKRCTPLQTGKVKFCYECQDFPCRNLKHIDERYRKLYRMSMIENLEFIKDNSMDRFLEKEIAKWKCQRCGGMVCCHNGLCLECEPDKLKNREKFYRWED